MTALNLVNDIVISIVLNAIKNDNKDLLESFGLPSDSIESLKEIDKNVLVNLSNHNCLIKVKINCEALKSLVQKTTTTILYNERIKEAILLGATRDIMHKYASLSQANFKRIRLELGMKQKRSITSLSYEDSNTLDEVIKEQIEGRDQKVKVSLSILVDLSKKSDLPINAIYSHLIEFWSNKYDF